MMLKIINSFPVRRKGLLFYRHHHVIMLDGKSLNCSSYHKGYEFRRERGFVNLKSFNLPPPAPSSQNYVFVETGI